MGIGIERAFEKYVAVDIPPEVDYEAVRNRLDEFESNNILEYETCEARVEGSFDDSPKDPEN